MNDPIRHPLAYARQLRDWSQKDLVKALHSAAAARPEGLRSGIDVPAVSRWENGHKTPSLESQLLIAAVFAVPADELNRHLWPHWLPGREDPFPLGQANTVPALRAAQKDLMDRRNFMAFGAVALAGLSAQWADREPGRLTAALDHDRTGSDLVDWLESASTRLTGLPTEQRQHAAKLLDAHLDTVTDLIAGGRYSADNGQRLHLLAASLASTCGWYRFDQGQHFTAGRLWNAALTSAHAAGDRDMGAGILSDFAYQAIWLDKPGNAIAPLSSALTRTRHPAARSLLHLRRARAHAATGAGRECHADLATAERELQSDTREATPSWCSWMSPADLAVDSGHCFLDSASPPRPELTSAKDWPFYPAHGTNPRCFSRVGSTQPATGPRDRTGSGRRHPISGSGLPNRRRPLRDPREKPGPALPRAS